MVTYLDTAQGTAGTTAGDLIQGSAFSYFPANGAEVPFFLCVANNLISGQAAGQTVTFRVISQSGDSYLTVGYGQTNTVHTKGYTVQTVSLPASPNADVRVVVDTSLQRLMVQTVTATATISGTIKTDFGQSTAPAAIVSNTLQVANATENISGTQMIVASIQDPPQVAVTGGKAVPVKTET
jgi:hypothetical protein